MAAISGWEAVIANVGDSCAYMDTGVEVVLVSVLCRCLYSAFSFSGCIDMHVGLPPCLRLTSVQKQHEACQPSSIVLKLAVSAAHSHFLQLLQTPACINQDCIATAPDHSPFECR